MTLLALFNVAVAVARRIGEVTTEPLSTMANLNWPVPVKFVLLTAILPEYGTVTLFEFATAHADKKLHAKNENRLKKHLIPLILHLDD